MYIDALTLEELDSSNLQLVELGDNEKYGYINRIMKELYHDNNKDENNNVIVNGWGRYFMRRYKRSGSAFEGGGIYNQSFIYDYRRGEWSSLSTISNSMYFSCYNGNIYIWIPPHSYSYPYSQTNNTVVKSTDNSNKVDQISTLSFSENILGIEDGKTMPVVDDYARETISLKQFFLKDETKMYFYDEDTSSIRMLKKR